MTAVLETTTSTSATPDQVKVAALPPAVEKAAATTSLPEAKQEELNYEQNKSDINLRARLGYDQVRTGEKAIGHEINSGPVVKQLKQDLNDVAEKLREQGHNIPGLTDLSEKLSGSEYDAQTKEAVKALQQWQAQQGVDTRYWDSASQFSNVDGVVGLRTMRTIETILGRDTVLPKAEFAAILSNLESIVGAGSGYQAKSYGDAWRFSGRDPKQSAEDIFGAASSKDRKSAWKREGQRMVRNRNYAAESSEEVVPERQVWTKREQISVELPHQGEVKITGGYMEPEGHSRKGAQKAIVASSPDQVVNLPPARRNIGIDYVVDGPVVSLTSGTVISTGREGGYGNRVRIQTDTTYNIDGVDFPVKAAYAHLASYDPRPGERISAGQPIGEMGSTGGNYAPHVDLTFWVDHPSKGRIDISPNLVLGLGSERGSMYAKNATDSGSHSG